MNKIKPILEILMLCGGVSMMILLPYTVINIDLTAYPLLIFAFGIIEGRLLYSFVEMIPLLPRMFSTWKIELLGD